MTASSKKPIGDPLTQAVQLGTIGGKKGTGTNVNRGESGAIQTVKSLDVQQSGKVDRKQQTVYLPPSLIKWLKMYAVEEEMEISDVVRIALEKLQKEARSKPL